MAIVTGLVPYQGEEEMKSLSAIGGHWAGCHAIKPERES